MGSSEGRAAILVRRIAPTSFRGRVLAVVVFAAVVPMGLIGVWLNRSVVHAGEALLRSELDQSLDRISATIPDRWSARVADLSLMVHNEAAARLVSGSAHPLSPTDSDYLVQLSASVAPTIPTFEYRDVMGRPRWSSPAPPLDTTNDRRRADPSRGPTMAVQFPISVAGGAAIGEVVARVALAGVIPIDTTLRLPNGAHLQVVQSDGVALLPLFTPDSLLRRGRFVAGDGVWLAVHRKIADPTLELILAAPLDAYVQPFERTARTGALILAIVAFLALAMSVFLTTRLTSSLEGLARAADAVATGDLDHRVDGRGPDEVGRVASAFNSMTEGLRRTLGELSQRQALAAAGEYAASLSHEVRNGLTAIRVDLQRVEETAATAADRSLVSRALANLTRLDGIIGRSLHLSRSGRVPRRRVNLRRVLESAAHGADPCFAERGATLRRELDESSRWVMLGDPLALEQLFLNLLLNAAQALHAGASATLTLDADGSEASIVVADSGAGIAPAHLAKVFDPFFSTKADGTGLGLPIARQIAVAHGGSLNIESESGVGTRVEVRLPLARQAIQ